MATKAEIKFVGDSSVAVTAVRRLKTEMGELQSMAAKSLGNFGGILTGGAIATGLVAITKQAVDAGDALYKMSQKTGLAVEDLSKLQYAADLSGVSTEALQKGLTAMSTTMVEAGTGSGEAAEQFKKMGISVRNTDGTMRSSLDVLYDLADQFATMPDGVEKTNLAVSIFGKKLGAEMIPLLNQGRAGLKGMADEAERLGIVMSTELAKKSEEFNDNMERLSKLSEAAGISIAGHLIVQLNNLLGAYMAAQAAGLGMWDSLAVAARNGNVEENIARITATLARLRKQQDDINSGKLRVFGTDTSEEIAKQEKLLALYQARQDASDKAEALNAAKRVALENKYQETYIKLLELRAIASGKVSSDILLDDTKRTDVQIKNAEKLKAALNGAWQDSLKNAQAASADAQKLLAQAADVRTTGSDRAAALRRKGMTPEEQQAEILKQYGELSQSASQSAGMAKIADFNGRTESAAKLAAQAARDAERAAKLAEQIDDPEEAARAVERIAEIQASLLEQQAKEKQEQSEQLRKDALELFLQMRELDQQLTELQTKAASLKVEIDVTSAEAALAQLQAQIDAMKPTASATIPMQEGSGYAAGGWTGPGGKYKVAGVVHADEFVTRQEIVRQPGALAFLARFNKIGMAALKGYASGGLVSGLRMPSLVQVASKPTSSATFNFPGMGSFPVQMAPDVLGELTTAFKRQALKRGGRR